MEKRFLIDMFLWGAVLWFVGWVLGIIFFMIFPANIIGWILSPIGIIITLWVLFKKINPPADKTGSFTYYLKISVAWTMIAIVLDYFFLVKLFKPVGYYKPDVYFYYFMTFALPLVAWYLKPKNSPVLIEKQAKEKEEHLQKMKDFMDNKDKVTNREIVDLLGVSDKTVRRYFDELEKESKVKQVGQDGRNVFYTKI